MGKHSTSENDRSASDALYIPPRDNNQYPTVTWWELYGAKWRFNIFTLLIIFMFQLHYCDARFIWAVSGEYLKIFISNLKLFISSLKISPLASSRDTNDNVRKALVVKIQRQATAGLILSSTLKLETLSDEKVRN